jgi:hypothetical protein
MEIFLVWLIFAALVGWLAHSRGRSGFGFFLIAALLSPLVGLIAVLVTKNLNEEQQKEQLRREEHERQVESIRAIAGARHDPSAAQAHAPAFAGSVADELAKLAALRDQSVITEPEFQAQKARLLGLAQSTTGRSGVVPNTVATTGLCPNCDAEIPVNSAKCPKCSADFASGSAWAVKPLLRPR